MRSVDHHTFAERGYVHLPAAASEDVADDLRSRLWSAMGLSPHDPAGWTRPVVWATDLEDGPGATIMSSRSLRAALDTLLGVDTWQPRRDVGTIPVRFPVFPPTTTVGGTSIRTPWARTGNRRRAAARGRCFSSCCCPR